MLYTIQHQFHRQLAYLVAVLVDGGEGYGKKFGVGDVVKADEPDLLRHSDAHADQRSHEVRRRQIITADNAVGHDILNQLTQKLRVFYIAVKCSGGECGTALAECELVAGYPIEHRGS